MKLDRIEIINTMLKLNYKVELDDTKRFNFNIVGIRTNDKTPNVFNDWLCLIWKYQNGWEMIKFPITTEPGTYWLENPMNVEGTAILKEGQYIDSWKLGLHKGQYEALVQTKKVKVYRDKDKDKVAEIEGNKEFEGIFGINIHRANPDGESVNVNKWSAACQVFSNSDDFAIFINLIKRNIAITGKNSFTYTLLNENDL